jgi:hypothetical protein
MFYNVSTFYQDSPEISQPGAIQAQTSYSKPLKFIISQHFMSCLNSTASPHVYHLQNDPLLV